MHDKCKDSIDEFKLLQYFLDFESIKSADKEFCKLFYKLLKETLELTPNLSKLKELVNITTSKLLMLEKCYKSVLERFPNSLEVKEMYGSLLMSILNDQEQGTTYVTLKDNIYSTKISKNV